METEDALVEKGFPSIFARAMTTFLSTSWDNKPSPFFCFKSEQNARNAVKQKNLKQEEL